jgi:short subunit fatty acids transporter
MNEKIILKLVVFSIVLARLGSILPVIRGITLMEKKFQKKLINNLHTFNFIFLIIKTSLYGRFEILLKK